MHDSLFGDIPLIPDDPIFGLSAAFKNDQNEQKVNVVIGAYRSDEGLPWVLPVVKKVKIESTQRYYNRMSKRQRR